MKLKKKIHRYFLLKMKCLPSRLQKKKKIIIQIKKGVSLMNKIPECYSIYFISQFQEMGQIEGIDVI